MIKQLNWSEDCDGDFTASSVFGAYGVFRGGHRTHNMYTPSANNPKVFDAGKLRGWFCYAIHRGAFIMCQPTKWREIPE